MRRHPIDAEATLWWRLRSRKLGGLKFRRQQPMGPYIADFICFEARLIVEVDGAQHRYSLEDIARTEELTVRGFKVIRFENDRVRVDTDRVCEEILEAAKSRLGTPSSDPATAGPPSCAEHERQLGGASPLASRMAVKG